MENRNRKNSYRKNNSHTKTERPKRKRRVNVDRNVEVVVVNNSLLGRFVYENPRIQTSFDMQQYGDEEYVTVGELRTMVNSSRKIFETFQLLITEVLDQKYTLDDVLVYLGLDRIYEEYYEMTPKWKRGQVNVGDFQMFIEKTSPQRFEQLLSSMDEKLRNKVIETSVVLFKNKKFNDYQKMKIIESFTNEELFLDAEDTETDVQI